MKFELLGYISNINVAKWSSTLFFFPVIAAVKILTVSAVLFSLVGKKTVVPESQFHFDQPDPAVAGNVDGIGNIATFSIPESQVQDRSVNHIYI